MIGKVDRNAAIDNVRLNELQSVSDRIRKVQKKRDDLKRDMTIPEEKKENQVKQLEKEIQQLQKKQAELQAKGSSKEAKRVEEGERVEEGKEKNKLHKRSKDESLDEVKTQKFHQYPEPLDITI